MKLLEWALIQRDWWDPDADGHRREECVETQAEPGHPRAERDWEQRLPLWPLEGTSPADNLISDPQPPENQDGVCCFSHSVCGTLLGQSQSRHTAQHARGHCAQGF